MSKYWGGWPGGRDDRPKSLNFSVNKGGKIEGGGVIFLLLEVWR